MTFVQVSRFPQIIRLMTLQLLLLLLPLLPLHASPCPTTVEKMVVATTSDVDKLAEALLCDGPGNFTVSWHGDVFLSRTLSVSNGSTLNVAGSSKNKDGADTGAVVISDGTILLFQVDLGSTVSLTGLTLSGGDGALRVAGKSFVEVIDCNFTHNVRTSGIAGGWHYRDCRPTPDSTFSKSFRYREVLTDEAKGGAIYVDGSNVVLKGKTVLTDNTGDSGGGAIYVADSTIFLKGETVFANNTGAIGGAIYSDDGGEFNVMEGGSVFFNKNHAGFIGAVADDQHGDSSFDFGGQAVFANNTAIHGGVFFLGRSFITLRGEAFFVNNKADVSGGAIYKIGRGRLNVMKGGSISFFNNHAGVVGGAIYLDRQSILNIYGNTSFVSNGAEYRGGAIHLSHRSVINSYGGNASFVSNEAEEGGAIHVSRRSVMNSYGGNASFVSNEAGEGGAIYYTYYSEGNYLGRVWFEKNYANGGGGGAVHILNNSKVSFGGETIFANNTAEENGGAVNTLFNSNVSFGGETIFVNNTAQENGGALYINRNSNTSVGGKTVFTKNIAGNGGAVYVVVDSNASFGGETVFASNTAENGGAVYIVDDSNASFRGETVFSNNTAENGGAIYSSESTVWVKTGTSFRFNVASTGSGGGVYASRSNMSLNKAVFTGNRGARGGGVAAFSSGSIWDEKNRGFGPSNITGCSFDGNTATNGGAIYTAAGYDMVINSSFTRNFAAVQGGALLHSGVLVALTGCTFNSNMAGEDGLAVMSLGMAEEISALSFRNNSFFCSSGEYGLTEDRDFVEDPDICRWGVVCSRCTYQCDVPTDIDMDQTTVPVCEVVPEGVNTKGNSGMTLESLNLMPGFYRTSKKSKKVSQCYREQACVGGLHVGRYCADGYAGPCKGLQIAYLAAGHCGTLLPNDCATCDKGYVSGFQYSCHSCHGSEKWAAIGGAVAAWVVIISVVALVVTYLVGVVERPVPERRGKWERRISIILDRLARSTPLTAVKIVLVTWQIITQVSSVVNVQYPPAYEAFLAALTAVNLNWGSILSLPCVVETNFYAQLVFATITPVAVLGILAITYRVALIRNGHSIHAIRVTKNKHISAGLFLLLIVYSSASYAIFQTFVCDPMDSGVTYLRADYNLVCWTKAHVGYMTYAGFMVLVYPVGVPAVFAWALFTNWDGMRNVVEDTINSFVHPETETIKDLWVPYKRSRYYYEVIECGRRIALAGLAVFICPGSTAQMVVEALISIVFYIISEILSPFAEPLDAWLYRSGTCLIYLSMYLALLLKMEAADEDSDSHDIFAGLLIAAHVGMVLVVIANAMMSGLKGFREVRAIEMPLLIRDPSKNS